MILRGLCQKHNMMHTKKLNDLYRSLNKKETKIREISMGRTRMLDGGKRNEYIILMGEIFGKQSER
jgi:hypothetical protein